MAIDPILLEFLKILTAEGIKGGINILRDMRKERKELGILEEVAQIVVMESLELKPKFEGVDLKPIIEWDNVASLFWLGNDLMEIKDMMYRGAMPEWVLDGIEEAMKYTTQLGFSDKSYPVDRLTISKTIIESLVGITEIDEKNFGLLQQHYQTAEQYVECVRSYIGARVKKKQPDFERL
jgi:hypothetical protein